MRDRKWACVFRSSGWVKISYQESSGALTQSEDESKVNRISCSPAAPPNWQEEDDMSLHGESGCADFLLNTTFGWHIKINCHTKHGELCHYLYKKQIFIMASSPLMKDGKKWCFGVRKQHINYKSCLVLCRKSLGYYIKVEIQTVVTWKSNGGQSCVFTNTNTHIDTCTCTHTNTPPPSPSICLPDGGVRLEQTQGQICIPGSLCAAGVVVVKKMKLCICSFSA